MNWGNAAQEKVAFWLHEPPGWEKIYHQVSPPVVFWLHLRPGLTDRMPAAENL
jgi:hypothetical protein